MAKVYLRRVNRPRIAYLSALDPKNVRAWSGLHSTVFNRLHEQVGDVTALGPRDEKTIVRNGRIYSLISRKLTGKRFDYTHSLKLARAYGRFFTEKLRQGRYDLVFATSASTELAFLETDLPVYYTADATFANVVDYYPFYTRLSERSKREGNEIQKRALEKCCRIFLPSEWAANSAVNDYKIDRSKIEIVPFGACLKEVPVQLPTHHLTAKKVQLLFVGVEWERKGGPVVVDAVQNLKSRGWDVALTIVGCNPDLNLPGVEIIPFLSKNDPVQAKRLNDLFLQADFFILPTTAECFGLVFAEASAMGTPVLARNTGGVSGVVNEGTNGFLLPESAKGEAYAAKIVEVLNSEKYNSLRQSSRALYESSLNWNAWGEKVANVILSTHSR